jgi:hypothetical protein
LRNILRLQLGNQRAQQIITHFQSHGRDAALQAMRCMLLLWIRDNANVEPLPGVSVASWVCMEGYASMQAFIEAMRKPRVWVDTPMLVAASGVFEIQVVCFVGPS